jgi:orotate phosphoribosyltransferase
MYEDIARITSLLLWRCGCIQVRDREPFRLASGNCAPVYINCRALISDPSAREIVISFTQYLLADRRIAADCIAGGETAGIPFGAWLAQRLAKPFVYVRKKAKGYGIGTRVEGSAEGTVVLFEDLITDGGSKLGFVDAIREAGASISDCLVVADREQGGAEELAKVGVRLHALADISACLKTGVETGAISAETLRQVQDYFRDPDEWNRRHGTRD